MDKALLSEHDRNLNLNREFVPIPQDGFYDPYDTETRQSERFQPLRTIAFVCCYSAALALYIVILVFFVELSGYDDTAVILAASLHVPLLVLAGLMEGVLRLQHRRRQSLGYLEFYRQTKKLLPIPFQTAAYSVAALFLLESWSKQSSYLPEKACMYVICLLEGVAIAIYDFFYIRRVLRHNRKETLPDASKYLQTPLTDIPDTRRRKQDVVFDNQVEVIRYLQKQTMHLQSEILKLRESSQHKGVGEMDSTGVPLDDQKYLIATGEQRIRALKAEVEALKSENEMVRQSFMDLRQNAQKFQALFDHQRKENQRLRGTLEEWSRRNARLESKLNKALETNNVMGGNNANTTNTLNTINTSSKSNHPPIIRTPKSNSPSTSQNFRKE